MKYLFLGLLFTVRLEHLQEKTLKEHNSLGRCDQFLVSRWFPDLLFSYFCCDNLVVSVSGRRVLIPSYPSKELSWTGVRVGAGPAEGAAAAGVRSGPGPGAWRGLRAIRF